MPINRNALIRYKTIDNCLRNKYRSWTLDDLIDACSEALYEFEGIDKGVSRRTVQMDIQLMRSNKLGYNAPIVIKDKKYYAYSDAEYSITNIPLTDQDLGTLSEVVQILKQFKGFSHFEEIGGMVNRLEDKIYTSKTHSVSVIDFEKNDRLTGLHYLDTLYQAIIKKQVLNLTYQSFKAAEPQVYVFHPYLLKEYRNRWFILGVANRVKVHLTLALDRIKDISVNADFAYRENTLFNPSTFFENVIGVTKNAGQRPEYILFWIDKKNAPYVITKPIHNSQRIIKEDNMGIVFQICVVINFELERELLDFGDFIEVIRPRGLRKRIEKRLKTAGAYYEESKVLEIDDEIVEVYSPNPKDAGV
ncbi:WYL domain-containing protein [Solitalea longa]|uniref:WYL domain-containing protein n=1 Tax=Solitalea longa TaxID=2079460 RepID=A0A2S5A3V3_9SPHI|nr:WYL domain-containing protein [Solitalea longa]POY37215.1 WYL domain-containing protein [Solitalea longa]